MLRVLPQHSFTGSFGLKLKVGVSGLIVGVLVLEACSQGYVAILRRNMRAVLSNPAYYYQQSTNMILGYELRPNTKLCHDNKSLTINRFGARSLCDDIASLANSICILGDSIVFGTGLSQEHTISDCLERDLRLRGYHVPIVNLGVPGYNHEELLERLRESLHLYRPCGVVYVLNLNDFCRRNTIYEGADNGLYRMYIRPKVASLWLIRKVVYRLRKGGAVVSTSWYRWIYEGNWEKCVRR